MRPAARLRHAQAMADRALSVRPASAPETRHAIIVPRVSSERREYIPMGFLDADTVISNLANAIYDAEPGCSRLLQSRMHMAWVGAVGGRHEDRLPLLRDALSTTRSRSRRCPTRTTSIALTERAFAVLGGARAFSDQTLAELYDPEKMPARSARGPRAPRRRLSIGSTASAAFASDDERLELLFEMYEQLTAPRRGVGSRCLTCRCRLRSRPGRAPRPTRLGCARCRPRRSRRASSQYLLIKAPPASGKSRALMFLALDKLYNQGLKKVIVAVPERSIGASFASTELTDHGFFADWDVEERNNLCTPGAGRGQGRGGRAVPRRRRHDPRLHARDAALRPRRDRRGRCSTTRCWRSTSSTTSPRPRTAASASCCVR